MTVEQYIPTEKIDVSQLGDDPETIRAMRGKRGRAQEKNTVLFDKYEVIEVIHKGSVATIFKVKRLVAEQDSPNQYMALKVRNDESVLDEHTKKRFKTEFDYLKSLEHENIVKAYEFFQIQNININGVLFADTEAILMEYVEGVSLENLIPKKINVELIDKIFKQALSALQLLHENRIIHRNLKPSSIIVTRDDQVKLCDFSSVCDKNQKTLTAIDMRLGCPQYRAPEYHDFGEVDPQIDIYSMGIIMSELVLGKKLASRIMKQKQEKYVPKLNPALPKILLSAMPPKYRLIAKRAIRENPSRRYQNADRMMRDFKHDEEFLVEGYGPMSAAVQLEYVKNTFYDGPLSGAIQVARETNWKYCAPVIAAITVMVVTVVGFVLTV